MSLSDIGDFGSSNEIAWVLTTGEASDSQQSLEGGTIDISSTVGSSVAVVAEKAGE